MSESRPAPASLAEAIARVGNPVDVLRNAPARPTVFPVTPEFSNWRSEQLSWRTSVALLDQSHHMTDLFLTGPDALKLLSDVGVNSFDNFHVDNAKQFIAVNSDGYLIGDAILFYLAEESFDLVGHPMVIDWVQYHLETGDYDATFERNAPIVSPEDANHNSWLASRVERRRTSFVPTLQATTCGLTSCSWTFEVTETFEFRLIDPDDGQTGSGTSSTTTNLTVVGPAAQ